MAPLVRDVQLPIDVTSVLATKLSTTFFYVLSYFLPNVPSGSRREYTLILILTCTYPDLPKYVLNQRPIKDPHVDKFATRTKHRPGIITIIQYKEAADRISQYRTVRAAGSLNKANL